MTTVIDLHERMRKHLVWTWS